MSGYSAETPAASGSMVAYNRTAPPIANVANSAMPIKARFSTQAAERVVAAGRTTATSAVGSALVDVAVTLRIPCREG